MKCLNAPRAAAADSTRGSALILALWILLTLALLIGGFAFEMHVEAGLTSYARKRFRADYLAQSGVEWAQALLARSREIKEDDELTGNETTDALRVPALNLKNGNAVTGFRLELGDGAVTVDIQPETGRRNVNTLSDEDWEELLDQAGVPQEQWSELIDCFGDWTDDNDFSRLNGAESDDPFYRERGYEVKNAPLDTVDELRLIKGFSEAVLFGGPGARENDPPLRGIAQWLTTWDDGKVNLNTASREVLFTLGLDEMTVDRVLEKRLGEDGEAGTEDDGLKEGDLAALGLDGLKNVTLGETRFVRVVSVGESAGVRGGIWAVLYVGDADAVRAVYWREEPLP